MASSRQQVLVSAEWGFTRMDSTGTPIARTFHGGMVPTLPGHGFSVSSYFPRWHSHTGTGDGKMEQQTPIDSQLAAGTREPSGA